MVVFRRPTLATKPALIGATEREHPHCGQPYPRNDVSTATTRMKVNKKLNGVNPWLNMTFRWFANNTFHFQFIFSWMLGGSVGIWTKSIQYRFIDFDMPIHAWMNFVLNVPKQVALCSKPNTPFEHAPQMERNYWYCKQINKWKIIEGPTPGWKVTLS